MKTTTTCIAAITEGRSVWLMGDSAGVSGLSVVVRTDKKVFVKTDVTGSTQFGFGFTSSFRMGQLIQFDFNIPALPVMMDLYEYMVSLFIPELRACLKDGGFSVIDNNAESGGTFLVGVKGRIFDIEDDFQVGENFADFSACGCGRDLALGALYATQHLGMDPSKRLTLALEAAQEFNGGVRAPFNLIQVN